MDPSWWLERRFKRPGWKESLKGASVTHWRRMSERMLNWRRKK